LGIARKMTKLTHSAVKVVGRHSGLSLRVWHKFGRISRKA